MIKSQSATEFALQEEAKDLNLIRMKISIEKDKQAQCMLSVRVTNKYHCHQYQNNKRVQISKRAQIDQEKLRK